MTVQRWRVAGLAVPNSGWFSELARWSTAAAVPVDFIKCVSVSEVRERFASGEVFSALLVGAAVGGLDRSLISDARAHGAAVIVVTSTAAEPQNGLGATATLPESFGRDELVVALTQHARPAARAVLSRFASRPQPVNWKGRLIVVAGSGGVGKSVLAAALAQGLAAEASNRGLVLLADASLHADQAVIHDARDVTTGLQELVEACEAGWIGTDQLQSFVLEPYRRGYHLLLGLRRPRDWAELSRRRLGDALTGLTSAYRLVVADSCAHGSHGRRPGQAPGAGRRAADGSELLARAVTQRGDLVAVVGSGDTLGIHALVRALTGFAEGGVPAERLLPVVNRSPRRRRSRQQITAALSELLEGTVASGAARSVCVREHRGVEPALRDGVSIPPGVGRELTKAVVSLLEAL